MKNIVLCEFHNDVLNGYTQNKIADFLKTIGYKNFFYESKVAGALSQEDTLYLEQLVKLYYDALVSEIDFSDETILHYNTCPSTKYSKDYAYTINIYLFYSKIISGYNLFGFDIDSYSSNLDDIIQIAENNNLCPSINFDNKANTNFTQAFIDCIRSQNIEQYYYDSNILTSTDLSVKLDYNSMQFIHSMIENFTLDTVLESIKIIENRDNIIVENILKFSELHSGNVFNMGVQHCYDLMSKLEQSPTLENFFFVFPLSQQINFEMLLLSEEFNESISDLLNYTLPIKNPIAPPTSIISNSALFDFSLEHSDQFFAESSFDLHCSLEDYKDVELCFEQFIAKFN